MIKTKQNRQNTANDSISNVGREVRRKSSCAQEHDVFSVMGLLMCKLALRVGVYIRL